jgi:hypothetical protein
LGAEDQYHCLNEHCFETDQLRSGDKEMAIHAARIERVNRYSQEASAETIERHPIIRLPGNVAYRAKRQSEVIRVIFGSAWITFDSQDWLVYGGEEITLTPGNDDAVIASLDGNPLVFAIIG